MFNSTLSITGTNISRVSLLLCAESLRNLPSKIGSLSEGLELRHLPLHDALGWKRANQLIHLIFRCGFHDKGSSEGADSNASSPDLAVFPQLFESWDGQFLEGWMCWPDCISRFSKSWSVCARRGRGSRRREPERREWRREDVSVIDR
jgi:hypothetical protein